MSSESQKKATTPAGSDASGRKVEQSNRLIYGEALYPTESRDEFAAHDAGVFADLCPVGLVETQIVESISDLTWRLKNLKIFRVAADKRKYLGPLLKNSYEATMDQYFRYKGRLFKAEHEDVLKRHSITTEEEAAAYLRETYKRDFPPDRLQELEESIKNIGALKLLKRTMEDWKDECFATLKEHCGQSMIDEILSDHSVVEEDGMEIELAYEAHFITPENYLAELKLAKAIKKEIDRELRRYWKLKEEKRKNREKKQGGSGLLPPYRA